MSSIAVVVLDTMRKDVFDEYFDWIPGVHFEHAFSTANYTVPSHGSLFTGQYPSEAGIHAKSETFDYPRESLAEAVSEAGHTTRAYSANPLVSPLKGFDRGFDEFNSGWHIYSANPDLFDWSGVLSKTRLNQPWAYPYLVGKCLLDRDTPTIESLIGGLKMYRSPDDSGQEICSWVQRTEFNDDEFLFINLMEAHRPYDPPKEYKKTELPDTQISEASDTILGGDADHSALWEAYHDSVRYLSDIYESMFERLHNQFDYVVTASDHGEMFGEHGASAHYHGVYEELTHVPLVVSDGRKSVDRCTHAVSILDIHQTVLDVTRAKAKSQGRSLIKDGTVSKPGDGEYLTEFLGFRPHRLDILSQRGFSREVIERYNTELYGLVCGQEYYGFETPDGFVDRGEPVVASPEDRIEQLCLDRDIREVEEDRQEISEKTRRQLEELGYA